MAYTPKRGDIIHLAFDPSAGHEMKGPHYALVLSTSSFNQYGLAMVCPISQGEAASARTRGLLVSLMGTGTETQGSVHCHQLKSLDWKIRQATYKESVPQNIVEDVLARINSIFD